jgi:hypothetical protein
MKRTPKMQAAWEALLEFYVQAREKLAKKKMPEKMRAAIITLAKRYDDLRESLRETGQYVPISCVCKIDRVVLTTDNLVWSALLGIPGYRADKKPRRLWNRDYLRARRIKGTGSVREIVINYRPTASWFAPFRITIIPRDTTGLQFDDLRTILELLPGAVISLLEVAWDFPSDSVVDLEFVYHWALFGSTWIKRKWNPFHGKWGNANSKFVRAYFKWDTSEFRIELQLQCGFLRHHHIDELFDIGKLSTVLVPDHIEFFTIDRKKLIGALQNAGKSSKEIKVIRARVRGKQRIGLWYALRYLRQDVGLTNTRRLLIPVDEPNRVVREAIEKLLVTWPSKPTGLGRKP